MKKNYYLAASDTKAGKNFAYVLEAGSSNNLLYVLAGRSNLKYVNICDSKKEAKKIVDFWNDCYKKNDTYALFV